MTLELQTHKLQNSCCPQPASLLAFVSWLYLLWFVVNWASVTQFCTPSNMHLKTRRRRPHLVCLVQIIIHTNKSNLHIYPCLKLYYSQVIANTLWFLAFSSLDIYFLPNCCFSHEFFVKTLEIQQLSYCLMCDIRSVVAMSLIFITLFTVVVNLWEAILDHNYQLYHTTWLCMYV